MVEGGARANGGEGEVLVVEAAANLVDQKVGQIEQRVAIRASEDVQTGREPVLDVVQGVADNVGDAEAELLSEKIRRNRERRYIK